MIEASVFSQRPKLLNLILPRPSIGNDVDRMAVYCANAASKGPIDASVSRLIRETSVCMVKYSRRTDV